MILKCGASRAGVSYGNPNVLAKFFKTQRVKNVVVSFQYDSQLFWLVNIMLKNMSA